MGHCDMSVDGPIGSTPSFLLQPRFISVCSVARKDRKYIPPSPWRFVSTVVKKQCPGRHPWENTLRCLRERQGPSQKNIWQDRERVMGLVGGEHIWDVLNLGAWSDSSLILAGRNREMPLPSSRWTPQSSGFCRDWPLGWGVWRPQNPGGLGVGVGRAKGLREGMGSGPLQWTATKCWTKKYNKKTNVTS